MVIIDNSKVRIEIDGIEFIAKRGAKIIEIADEAGIYIPRFCYHKKLSIAANCRMCLVEVEKAPKLFPACATPVAEGMKILTNTEKVIAAQKAVMEFLLVNHPLDCPICDQGGECELQDLTVGYGCASSRFLEDKRSFVDYDFGPLVSTDVTRCILCSRCVRFCSEISGTDELGIVNRGSNSRIFTFLKEHLTSGLSGNVVDLCPVGALTAKPSKFKFRPWELIQKSFISSHDCLGSNLYVHVSRDKIIRVVPKRNDLLNEMWISDKDRFSYEGLYSLDRITSPMHKKDGEWSDVSWSFALDLIVKKIKYSIDEYGSQSIGALASSNSTCEEFYLLQKLIRSLGSSNLDHRLNQVDFKNQKNMPVFSGINISLDEIDKLDSVFIIGSDIVKEHPILGIKLRKIISNGGNVFILNPVDFNLFMNVTHKIIVNPKDFIYVLSCMIKNVLKINKNFKEHIKLDAFSDITGETEFLDFCTSFFNSKSKLILLGSYVTFSYDYSKLLALCNILSNITNSYFGILTDGANTSGAWLTGFVPHRLPGGMENNLNNDFNFLKDVLKLYILFGVEIENDSINAKYIFNNVKKADFVISFSSFKSDVLLDISDVILPITSSYENIGTFINISGMCQYFEPVVPADYEVIFGWEALINLANLLKLSGFVYNDFSSVTSEVNTLINNTPDLIWNFIEFDDLSSSISDNFIILPYFSQYNTDSLVRRASSLQKINANSNSDKSYSIKCNEYTYNKLELNKNKDKKSIDICIDNSISNNLVFVRDYKFSNYINSFLLYDVFLFDKF